MTLPFVGIQSNPAARGLSGDGYVLQLVFVFISIEYVTTGLRIIIVSEKFHITAVLHTKLLHVEFLDVAALGCNPIDDFPLPKVYLNPLRLRIIFRSPANALKIGEIVGPSEDFLGRPGIHAGSVKMAAYGLPFTGTEIFPLFAK